MMTGCQATSSVYPETKRKSLAELYHEAVVTAQNTPDRFGYLYSIEEGCVSPASQLPVNSGPDLPASPNPPLHLPPIQQVPPAHELTPVLQSEVQGCEKAGSSLAARSNNEHAKAGSAEPLILSALAQRDEQPASGDEVLPVVFEMSESTNSVTEFFEDTDVRQALQSLATQAGVTVIMDEQVGGVVSAVIEDEPFESGLKKVLLPLGLVYRQSSDGDYLVGVPDPSSSMFSKLSDRLDYRPLHLSPDELVNLVPERDRRYVQAVDARNRIMIEAPAEIAQNVLERLQQFDTPIPQVELEAIVCVVAPDRGFRSGLDWGHAVTLNGSEVFNFGMAGLSFAGQGSGAGISNTFSDFSVTSAFVKLLAQEGYLAIRAAPRVTARDGDQARISITRESFFSTQPQSDNSFFRQEIEQVQAGIELDITPIIRGDNITVKIEKAEVSEDIRTSQINSGITENPFPQINRRSVSTTVHVKDNQTIVIGGLVQRQTVDRIAKVPVLGDLPGIGRMFQTVEQKEQDVEVVIFISPRLVQPDACGP